MKEDLLLLCMAYPEISKIIIKGSYRAHVRSELKFHHSFIFFSCRRQDTTSRCALDKTDL